MKKWVVLIQETAVVLIKLKKLFGREQTTRSTWKAGKRLNIHMQGIGTLPILIGDLNHSKMMAPIP